MKKLAMSVACLLFMSGVVLAAEVTLLKYDGEKKILTVKESEAEKQYRITEKTKVSFVDKDGKVKEGTLEAATKVLGNEKAAGRLKFEIRAENGNVAELTLRARKAK